MPRLFCCSFRPALFAACTALAAGLPSRPARAQTLPAFGPLPVRLRDGISGAAYAVEPRGGSVLKRGVGEAFYHLDVGNTSFELQGSGFNTLREDSETQNHRLGVQRGLGGGWEGGATLAFATRNGGFLDWSINNWHHKVLRYNDDFRESFRNGNPAYLLLAGSAGNLRINDTNASAQTQTLALEARKAVWDTSKTRPSHAVLASARMGVKFALRGQNAAYYLDNGTTDVWGGLSVSGHVKGRLWLHADANVVYAGTGHILVFDKGNRFLPQAVVAAEYKAGAKTGLLIQAEDAQYPVSLPLPNYSNQRAQTTFGLWQTVGPQTRLFGSFSENIFLWGVTSYAPDVMFSFGLRQRL